MEKTIINFLKTLPAPYAQQAIINYDPDFHLPGEPVTNSNEALGWAFDWLESPQGLEYWMQLRRHLETGEALPGRK